MPISEAYLIDCMTYMQGIPDKFFDLAIVDPPYGIGISNATGFSSSHPFTNYKSKNWDNEIPSEEYFIELFRTSKNQIIWGANYFTKYIPVSKNWIVWDKLQPEGVTYAMFELAYYSGKSQPMIFRRIHDGNRCTEKKNSIRYTKIHHAQKPIQLYSWLLDKYAEKGMKILDTHMGSQSSRIASYKIGFDFYGCEIDEEYFASGCERFNRECLGEYVQTDGKIYKQGFLFENI